MVERERKREREEVTGNKGAEQGAKQIGRESEGDKGKWSQF